MNNPDSFIDEVTEEVRRDKLFAVFRRYGWIAVLAVLLIVGGAAYTEWRQARATAAAQAFGDRLMAALAIEDPVARATAVDEIPATGGQAAVLRFLSSGALRQGEDTARAVEELQAIEADATLDPVYRQLATLKRVTLQGAALAPDDRIAALSALTVPGAPYRQLAEEQIAMAEAEKGDSASAIRRLTALLAEDQVPAGLRQRAAQLIVALGGEIAQG